mmetsp:Transcript_33039/g.33480  ORF Transcript_33039/g.33480 Transcript_33039/m.33480 type:complete len:248 (+) Transcript_33039:301-1044(+)
MGVHATVFRHHREQEVRAHRSEAGQFTKPKLTIHSWGALVFFIITVRYLLDDHLYRVIMQRVHGTVRPTFFCFMHPIIRFTVVGRSFIGFPLFGIRGRDPDIITKSWIHSLSHKAFVTAQGERQVTKHPLVFIVLGFRVSDERASIHFLAHKTSPIHPFGSTGTTGIINSRGCQGIAFIRVTIGALCRPFTTHIGDTGLVCTGGRGTIAVIAFVAIIERVSSQTALCLRSAQEEAQRQTKEATSVHR